MEPELQIVPTETPEIQRNDITYEERQGLIDQIQKEEDEESDREKEIEKKKPTLH